MTSTRDELVEEIALKMFGEVDQYTRRIARESVALTLKAVLDGGLKIPGQIWRGVGEAVTIGDKIVWRGAEKRYRFIALRPTGTGEKE